MIELAFGTITSLLVITNLFWLYHYHKLVNKLMSKNYGEYAQVKKYLEPDVKEETKQADQMIDPYDRQRADELNQLMGMV